MRTQPLRQFAIIGAALSVIALPTAGLAQTAPEGGWDKFLYCMGDMFDDGTRDPACLNDIEMPKPSHLVFGSDPCRGYSDPRFVKPAQVLIECETAENF